MRAPLFIGLLCLGLFATACERGPAEGRKRIVPEYDPKTGKLSVLRYDSDGNGKTDTVSYMNGAVVVRIEIDKDEDGKVDRWEYYGADQKVEKIGFSRAADGKEDAWSYADATGAIVRVEISGRRDGTINRIERYAQNAVVAAEEDSDGDGTIDKWETYEGERLTSVAFDTRHRGTPDRRLIYDAKGGVRVEVDAAGDGHFVPVNPQSAIRNPQ